MESEFTHINICLVGCVSAGKSTILNAFFGQDYAQCKIKRTTMMPNKFIETNELKRIHSFDSINSTISQVNKEIYSQTEAGKQLTLEDYGRELTFYVGPMEMNVNNKLKICIYDIPGLNDARTKTIYYDYLKNNFHKFNIILFVVDIHSGLNTSDEMDILNFLTTNIKHHKITSQKNITMLTIVNKADDMQLNGDELEVLGELGEMFEQTSNSVTRAFVNNQIGSNLVGCIPICGLDAHLYRMIKKFKDINKLTDENILRIGINEEGSKFRKYSKEQQRSKVDAKILDNEFVDDMIKLSGFSLIEKALNNFISKQGVSMVSENTFYEYKKLPEMTFSNMIVNLKQRLELLLPLSELNDGVYSSEMKKVVKQLNTLVYKDINVRLDPFDIIKVYDRELIKPILEDNLLKKELNDFLDFKTYPTYLTDKILELVCFECSEKQISVTRLGLYIKLLEKIGIFNEKVVELLFVSILSNPKYTNTFEFDKIDTNSRCIEILSKLKIHKNFSCFLRFFLANYLDKIEANQLTSVLIYLTNADETHLRQFVSDLRIEKGLCGIRKNKQAYFNEILNDTVTVGDVDIYFLLEYYIENIE